MSEESFEFLVPGDLQATSGGYVYDRRILEELRTLGWDATVRALHASFPEPTRAALEHADRTLADIPDGRPVLIDGMAFSVMPQVLPLHAERLPLLALVHMPLGAVSADDPRRRSRLQQLEASALRSARRIIVTGRRSLTTLRAYRLPEQQMLLIEPGTDTAELARPGTGCPLQLLCVATIQPDKGHELLIEALAPLASLPWQLTCVGSLTRSPETVARLRARLRELNLSGRVVLAGEMPHTELGGLYRQSDLFVLATRFESYCMAAAEALAHGLPVVSTRTGAMPELVGTQAGRLVAPGDVDGLRAALAVALSDPAVLAGWAEGAAAARRCLPSWPDAAARLAALLREVSGPGAAARS